MTTYTSGHGSAQAGDTDIVGARALAQIVDGIVSLVAFSLVAAGVGALLGGLASGHRSPLATILAVGPMAMVLGSLVGGLVPVLLEWAWNGETVGKRLVGIRVVSMDGGPVGLGAALTRNLLAAVDGAFFYLVGLAAMSTSSDRQRIGDRVAGTVVVRR